LYYDILELSYQTGRTMVTAYAVKSKSNDEIRAIFINKKSAEKFIERNKTDVFEAWGELIIEPVSVISTKNFST
jgi:hypothetical protein